MSEQPQGEVQPQGEAVPRVWKKIPDAQWPAIRSLAEQGVQYKDIASQFGVSHSCIAKRACKEKWITPQRLAMAKNENVSADDPALAVVDLWNSRQTAMRESVYQGAKKSLERFFAMSPVPQSFAEAATAHKLLKDSIDPSGGSNSGNNVQVNILAAQGFTPKPAIDV
jgi:hypothetical protein